LVNYLYVPSLDDLYVDDIPADAIIVRDVVLTGVGQKKGVCYGTIPQFNALSSPYPVVGIILYSNIGDDTVSPLIYYSSTGLGFPWLALGFNYFVGFDASLGGWFQA
jgi:hypothetical protein